MRQSNFDAATTIRQAVLTADTLAWAKHSLRAHRKACAKLWFTAMVYRYCSAHLGGRGHEYVDAPHLAAPRVHAQDGRVGLNV
jgi:hypothetical protein